MKAFLASTALTFLGLSGLSRAGYTLLDNYTPSNFFGNFNFYTGDDPTHGFVNFVSQGTAQSAGLINTNNNQIYIGVDHTTVNPGGRGRNSVRLESKKQYTHGLFILDFAHMPGSICGTWPAFWTYGPNWPYSGEIDILEGVNSQATDFVTLHTGNACKAGGSGFSGQLTATDCSESTGGTTGCSIHSTNTQTYGNGFNSVGGGVYAMEWTSSSIKVWFFPRNGIPGDISSGNPNPSGWAQPMAFFPGSAGSCNVDQNFANHFIVFDNTFCGDWAGAAFGSDGNCNTKASSCQAYVAGNPSAFANSYWAINGLKVYKSSSSKRDEAGLSVASEGVAEPVNNPVVNIDDTASANDTIVSAAGAAAQIFGMSPNGRIGDFTEEMRINNLQSGYHHKRHVHGDHHKHF